MEGWKMLGKNDGCFKAVPDFYEELASASLCQTDDNNAGLLLANSREVSLTTVKAEQQHMWFSLSAS
jgi:hypothetical protein